MTTFVAFLRGINVSGKNLIKMDELKRAVEKAGFMQVSTYLQSGNLVFWSQETDPELLRNRLTETIKSHFGFNIQLLVMDAQKLKRITGQHPFGAIPETAYARCFVTMPVGAAERALTVTLEAHLQEGEKIWFDGETIYIYCPQGYGRTKLNNNLIEKKIRMMATTRNWKTMLEMSKLVDDSANRLTY